jgi:predicted ArsR family transcriptional regulator
MQATRQQILDHLRVQPAASVRDLVRLLGLTATGVRQHLTILEQEGLIESHEQRGRVGRPALRYALTVLGDAGYPKRYEELANALLDEVREAFGSGGLQRVARGVAGRMAETHASVRAQTAPEARVEAVAAMLRAQGMVADWEHDGSAILLHERTCPYPEVARRHAVTCAVDVALIRDLTGMDARLTECLVRGDGCCTYRLVPEQAATR